MHLHSLESCSDVLWCNLRSFRGVVTYRLRKNQAQQLYPALAAHCSHSSLQELIVEGGSQKLPMTADRLNYSVGGEPLGPLFVFTNLVMVSLEHPVGFDLDDSVIHDMACAHCMASDRIIISSARQLASHHPSSVTRGLNAEKKRVAQRTLRHLNVGYLLIPKP
ncbi:hypothetical protein C8R43DRAFT_148409 [Mycena crocata]|nr:hypothetical protein C8R43DRAFT_148409 [Mycena crocata]